MTNNLFVIPRGVFEQFPIFKDGADLLGFGLFIGILLFSIFRYLHLRRTEVPAASGYAYPVPNGASLTLLEFPVAISGPLLMFAGLAYGLNKLQLAHPELLGQAPWIEYKVWLWGLIAVVAMQQIFVVKRLRFDLDATSITLAKVAMLALPATLIIAICALKKIFFGEIGRVLDDLTLSVSIGSILGIALSLVYLINADAIGARSRAAAERIDPADSAAPQVTTLASAPELAAPAALPEPQAAPVMEDPHPAIPAEQTVEAPATVATAVLPAVGADNDPRDGIEAGLREISRLLGAEYDENLVARPDLDAQLKALEKEYHLEEEISPLVSQHVKQQQSLFEKGMPFNISALVNGLIILKKSVDLRDAVTGNSLLHLAAEAGDAELVQALLENGADAAAVNNRGLTAQDLTGDQALNSLLLKVYV
ncbi:MAG: ankyrin repeat domain-containing protein [Pseudomonadota bacterium]